MNEKNITAYRDLEAQYRSLDCHDVTGAQLLYDLKEAAWDNAYRDNLGAAADLAWDELGPYEEAISNQVYHELTA